MKAISYSKLLIDIGELLTRGRQSVEQPINTILLETNHLFLNGLRLVELIGKI